MKKLSVIRCQFPIKASLRLRAFVPLCYAFLLSFVLLAACIPAKVPPNLDDTPGPAVVLSDHIYENSQFTARYPDDWRVVTSEAQAPPSVIFVAPDDVSTIQLMVGALENGNFNNPKVQTDIRTLTLDGGLQITAVLSAPADQWDAILPSFERVLASIKPA